MNGQDDHLPYQQPEMAAAADAAVAADAMLAAMVAAFNNSNETGQGHKRKAADQEEEGPDPRMQLTDEERGWALEIKQAMKEDDDILACAITDMEIAIYAIVDRGSNMERSLERAVCMQAFRMTYNINDNVDEAIDMFRKLEESHPGCLLSIDECPNDDGKGGHLLVVDAAKFNPQAVIEGGPKEFRVFMGAMYYLIMATQSDLQSFRDGFRHLVECEGVSWSNINFQIESKKWYELLSFLPMNRRHVQLLRQPSVMACLHAFLRPIMKKENADKYKYGLAELDIEYPDRIDNYYLQPTPKIAMEAVMGRAKQFLTQRYKNERSFRL